MALYHAADFFGPALEAVTVSRVPTYPIYERIAGVARAVARSRAHVVQTFLDHPGLLGVLSRLAGGSFRLVTSERRELSLVPRSDRWKRKSYHLLADHVTTNSEASRRQLLETFPALRGRITRIYNGTDLTHFTPREAAPRDPSTYLLVLASVRPEKDGLTLIEALSLLPERLRDRVRVRWQGVIQTGGTPWAVYHERMRRAIAEKGLEHLWTFAPPEEDVRRALAAADALVLPSLTEGLSNSMCEAMASGLPVLVSQVSNNARIVEDGRSGFTFPPSSPRALAQVLEKFIGLDEGERSRLASAARARAERLFDSTRLVDEYEALYYALLTNRRPARPRPIATTR